VVIIVAVGDEQRVTTLLTNALTVWNVLANLRGWEVATMTGIRAVPNTDGNYFACELPTSVPIDITEGP
jgi:hypothetical protein